MVCYRGRGERWGQSRHTDWTIVFWWDINQPTEPSRGSKQTSKGHPSRYQPRTTLLNFSDLSGTNAVKKPLASLIKCTYTWNLDHFVKAGMVWLVFAAFSLVQRIGRGVFWTRLRAWYWEEEKVQTALGMYITGVYRYGNCLHLVIPSFPRYRHSDLGQSNCSIQTLGFR